MENSFSSIEEQEAHFELTQESFLHNDRAKYIAQHLQTSQNSDNAKLPTIEECYKAIPFPSNERDCAMFVAGIAECHKFVSRHFT